MSYVTLVRNLVISRVLSRLGDSDLTEQLWMTDLRAAIAADEPVGLDPASAADWWAKQVASSVGEPGPLGRLPLEDAQVLVAAGLIETDIRFGSLFGTLQDPLRSRRPCIGLVSWLLASEDAGPQALTAACHRLVSEGLLAVDNREDPRSEWVLRVPVPLWDLICTGTCQPDSLPTALSLRNDFPPLSRVALAPAARDAAARLPRMLTDDSVTAVVIRGKNGSGRTTLLGSAAATCGWDLLVYEGDPADPAWLTFGALARLADVLPAARCSPAPGETLALPTLPGLSRPLGVVLGRGGTVSGPQLERSLTVTLGDCLAEDRRRLWLESGLTTEDDLDGVVDQFLLTPGNVVRAGPLARIAAQAAGRDRVRAGDVRAATRSLRRQELETLASLLEPLPAGVRPVLGGDADAELAALTRRCLSRERLAVATTASHPGLNRGVRALFAGSSGTGKTMAARHLAAVLNLDLYRVDLGSVVNKYIGETERNLDRLFACAEELDVVLLLDEGDALMANRTAVSTANDRYANLETNFLLQRLETFDGIVLVTTNAESRIDQAFLRRIDATVDFVPPDAALRLQIWGSHLPPAHAVSTELLNEIATRCPLTGGQIRNATLHAVLLALEDGEVVGSAHVVEGVRREYRRSGAPCPLAGYPARERGWNHAGAS